MTDDQVTVALIGGGIGGLAAALQLAERGIECRVYESAPVLEPLGVGITMLPHATAELTALGLREALTRVAVPLVESVFFTRHGQLVHRDTTVEGLDQFMIHRGDLLMLLLDAVRDRLGPDAVVTGHRAQGVDQDDSGARVDFVEPATHEPLGRVRAEVVVGCDGIHSAVRAALHPNDGELSYGGIDMWRGVTVHPPFLTGGSHVKVGTIDRGRLIVYPIRDRVDESGNQLVNWVVEHRGHRANPGDWRRAGQLDDFISFFEDWRFEWLDVPDLLSGADQILEYPMVDREPLSWWTAGRVTLLGDAAHPMYPRGANGAAQALLDARALAIALADEPDRRIALARYEHERRPPTTSIVLTNRVAVPDDIIDVVDERTQGQPFDDLSQVVAPGELAALLDQYRHVASYDAESVATRRTN